MDKCIFWTVAMMVASTSAQQMMYPQYTWNPPYYSRRPPGARPPPGAPPGVGPGRQVPPGPGGPRYPPPPPLQPPTTCSPATCQLPDCFCAGKEAPGGMDRDKIPQMVMFTFDDAINEQVYHYYQELFPAERTNPNGCPVSATFFLSHNWTDYNMVKDLYLAGHEIASHSITHRMPQSWWTYATYDTLNRELAGQRDNIVQKASVPKSQVHGVRLPFLETGGDNLYKMLRDQGFEYDASFMTGPHAEGGLWPFTLDFPPKIPEVCGNNNCPKMRWPGIWEVALNRWYGTDGHPCAMVDSCQTQPSHKGEALSYLWQNFNRHYYGNKSPVGVNMHAVWFQTEHHFEAMKEFVATLAEMEDVYIVTVYQTIQWMKNPVPLEDAKDFEPWMTSCEKKGKKKLVKMVPRTKPHFTTTSIPEEDQDEGKEEQLEVDIEIDKDKRGKKTNRTKDNRIDKDKSKERKQPEDKGEKKGGERRGRGGRVKGQGGKADQQSGRGKSSSNMEKAEFVVTASGVLMVLVMAGIPQWV